MTVDYWNKYIATVATNLLIKTGRANLLCTLFMQSIYEKIKVPNINRNQAGLEKIAPVHLSGSSM